MSSVAESTPTALPQKFRVACLQLNSTDDVEVNIATGRRLLGMARSEGADFILTPENTGIMAARHELSARKAQLEEVHVVVAAYRGYGF
jgi:predicted amidohydrolase